MSKTPASCRPVTIYKTVLCLCYFLVHMPSVLHAQIEKTDTKSNAKGDKSFFNSVGALAKGLKLPGRTRILPYVTLENGSLFGNIQTTHIPAWAPQDRARVRLKMEDFSDYALNIRYDANGIRRSRNDLSFILNSTVTENFYFYGSGGRSIKSQRLDTRYTSIYSAVELSRPLSRQFQITFQGGYRKLTSGLAEGGSFERPDDASYLISGISIHQSSASKSLTKPVSTRWMLSLQHGLPVSNEIAAFTRLKTANAINVSVGRGSRFGIITRFEYLLAGNQADVPYFLLPGLGSGSGLRGFSKGRFRDFTVTGMSFEYSFPVHNKAEAFLLADFATTAGQPGALFRSALHKNAGIGFRINTGASPFAVGIAKSREGWQTFSALSFDLN